MGEGLLFAAFYAHHMRCSNDEPLTSDTPFKFDSSLIQLTREIRQLKPDMTITSVVFMTEKKLKDNVNNGKRDMPFFHKKS